MVWNPEGTNVAVNFGDDIHLLDSARSLQNARSELRYVESKRVRETLPASWTFDV